MRSICSCVPAAHTELQGKAALVEKLQELARSLQAQNKQIKEEDLLKRQSMLTDFQSTVDDIKARSVQGGPFSTGSEAMHCKSAQLLRETSPTLACAADWGSARGNCG